jgi:starch synthase
MRVLFVSSEVHPFAKTGGLADVAASLPAALRQKGHDVVTLMPLYDSVDRDRFGLQRVPRLTDVPIAFGPNQGTWSGLAHDATRTILVDIPQLYERGYLYGHAQDEPIRWAALSHVALQIPGILGWQPHILHCNDWQTGLIPLLIDGRRDDPMLAKTRTVMTIHNLGYQGHFGSLAVGRLGLEGLEPRLHQDHLDDGYIGFLETGLLAADAITTVSPTYAEEIKTPEGGAGLDGLLAQRSEVRHLHRRRHARQRGESDRAARGVGAGCDSGAAGRGHHHPPCVPEGDRDHGGAAQALPPHLGPAAHRARLR